MTRTDLIAEARTQANQLRREDVNGTSNLLMELAKTLEEEGALLAAVDAVLARRPALDKPTRVENIEHAIATAARADRAEEENARLKAFVIAHQLNESASADSLSEKLKEIARLKDEMKAAESFYAGYKDGEFTMHEDVDVYHAEANEGGADQITHLWFDLVWRLEAKVERLKTDLAAYRGTWPHGVHRAFVAGAAWWQAWLAAMWEGTMIDGWLTFWNELLVRPGLARWFGFVVALIVFNTISTIVAYGIRALFWGK